MPAKNPRKAAGRPADLANGGMRLFPDARQRTPIAVAIAARSRGLTRREIGAELVAAGFLPPSGGARWSQRAVSALLRQGTAAALRRLRKADVRVRPEERATLGLIAPDLNDRALILAPGRHAEIRAAFVEIAALDDGERLACEAANRASNLTRGTPLEREGRVSHAG